MRVHCIAQFHRCHPRRGAINNHNVRPHLCRIDLQPWNLCNSFRQDLRILMIDVQPRR